MIKFFKPDGNGAYKSINTARVWDNIHMEDNFSVDRDDGTISLHSAYASVSRVYRAVVIRSTRVASCPFLLFKGRQELDRSSDAYRIMRDNISKWFHVVEACLCIYGQAYMVIERNQYGRNPTPRTVIPTTMTPNYDTNGNVISFTRTTQHKQYDIPADDVLVFWYNSYKFENAPGVSPLYTCLGEAATVRNLARFAQMYFGQGALMPTLFFFGSGSSGMPSTVTERELEGFLSRVKRLLGGIKNAWRFDAMRGDVTAQQIGTLPKDVAAPELAKISLDAIAEAFGIPDSLLRSNIATYAAASADQFNFYDQTIIPELRSVILPVFRRWMEMQGMWIDIDVNRIEAFQSYQLQQAATVSQLVGQSIMTVNEAREMIGLPAVSGGDEIASVETDGIVNTDAMRAWKAAYDSAWRDY